MPCRPARHPPAGNGLASIGQNSDESAKEKHMKSLVRSALAAVAVTLAGCATYDYGSGYTYPQPYNGYNYDNGPYSYDDSPYYYGPSDYVAPSVGLGFTYRDHDRGNYDRNYNRHGNTDTGRDNDYRRGDNDQWRGDHNRSHSGAQASGRDDPWGGTNNPNVRNSQQ
jgi:hypothetical protein